MKKVIAWVVLAPCLLVILWFFALPFIDLGWSGGLWVYGVLLAGIAVAAVIGWAIAELIG